MASFIAALAALGVAGVLLFHGLAPRVVLVLALVGGWALTSVVGKIPALRDQLADGVAGWIAPLVDTPVTASYVVAGLSLPLTVWVAVALLGKGKSRGSTPSLGRGTGRGHGRGGALVYINTGAALIVPMFLASVPAAVTALTSPLGG